jgi:hypothetical protein
MASLNEIAYSIADKLGKPLDFLFIQDIKFSIINYRALFIRQDYTKTGYYNPLFIQDLGCLETETTDSAECCTFESGCNVVRTVQELPDPIRLKGIEDFVFVGGIDKRTRFGMILPEEEVYVEYSKYTKKLPRYSYLNKRIYLVNVPKGVINVRGIFADPRQVARFSRCGEDSPCYTDDSAFPCPEDMIVGIRNGILNGELRLMRETNEGEEVKTDS